MRIFFSVGEPSGDHHAARLIQELRRRVPHLRASGFGGPLMEQVGLESHYRLTDYAIVGFFRALPFVARLYGLYLSAWRILREERPDAVVLVDFPGFNWWIAHAARKLGIRVFYYLPPQLWAWAPWRIKRVRKNVDHVLCGLAFEQRWYAEHGVAAEYVGHPFFDEVQERRLDQSFLDAWSTDDHRNVGILPGSRQHEVELNFPIMLDCIRKLAAQHLNTRFLVACFNESHRNLCREILLKRPDGEALPLQLFVGKTPEIIESADCCLMVSGSVSLEMLARRTPAVVLYYWGWLPGHLAKLLVQCKYGSLPNLMADRLVLPEFYPHGKSQVAEEVDRITAQLSRWLEDRGALAAVADELAQLAGDVQHRGATPRAAELIISKLQAGTARRAA